MPLSSQAVGEVGEIGVFDVFIMIFLSFQRLFTGSAYVLESCQKRENISADFIDFTVRSFVSSPD